MAQLRLRLNAARASGILRWLTVRPFAVDAFGRFGEEAQPVLGDARQRVAERIRCRAAGGAMEGAWVAPLGIVGLPFERR